VNVCAGLIAAGTLAAVLSINDAESAIPDRCHARLLLRLTLDVPNPAMRPSDKIWTSRPSMERRGAWSLFGQRRTQR